MSGNRERVLYKSCPNCEKFQYWVIKNLDIKLIGWLNHEDYHPDVINGGVNLYTFKCRHVNMCKRYSSIETVVNDIKMFVCNGCRFQIKSSHQYYSMLIQYLREHWNNRSVAG